MDRFAQRIANFLGSAFVIIPYFIWVVYHTITIHDYVTSISDVTFLVGLLILRDEKVAAEKTDKNVKRDLTLSRKVLKLLQDKYER
jgi:hypothetical protein